MEYVLPTHLPRPTTNTLPPTRLLWVLTIFSMMAVLVLSELALLAAQAPRNPFADYTPLMPGQPESAAIERGFLCASIPNYTGTTCVDTRSLTLLSFSEIYIMGTQRRIIDRIGFIPRGDTLTIGDLTALWGRPTYQMQGSLVVVLCWPGVYALSPLNGNRATTYFSPVKMVEFSNRADDVCLPKVTLEHNS